ncbi:hypothetical protein BH20ACI4_BH20ACI4_09400 [soil metagenome]
MRKLMFLFLFFVIGTIVTVFFVSKVNNKAEAGNSTVMELTGQQTQTNLNISTVTVNGEQNPELVSDVVAYSVVFRLLSNRETESEGLHAKSYLKSIGLNESDVRAFLVSVNEFQQRVTILDRQVKTIKDQTFPNPSAETMVQLAQIHQQKESLVMEIVASMPSRLSVEGLQLLRRHIDKRVKRGIKIYSGPLTPPTGADWKPSKNHH